MTDEARGTEDGVADPEHHLTAEDTGTTTDPADLTDDGDSTAGAEATPAVSDSDDSIGHVFDQTNGVADGLDGDSDGSAQSDLLSAERRDEVDPTIADDDVYSDDDGVHDLRDQNP